MARDNSDGNENSGFKRHVSPKRIGYALGGSLLALTAYNSYYKAGPNENVVLVTLGQISRVAGPGAGPMIPFIQSAVTYPADVQQVAINQQRPACGRNNPGDGGNGESTYTLDRQVVYAGVTAQFFLPGGDDLATIHRSWQGYRSVVASEFTQAMKQVLGGHNTTDIPQRRGPIADAIQVELSRRLAAQHLPLRVSGVQFGKIDFACEYERGVEAAAEAKNEQTRRETERETARITAERTLIDANAARQQAELQGQGEASRILARTTAEAEGVRRMQDALAANPLIVAYTQASRWNGALPQTMLGSSPVPFLNLESLGVGRAAPARPEAPVAAPSAAAPSR